MMPLLRILLFGFSYIRYVWYFQQIDLATVARTCAALQLAPTVVRRVLSKEFPENIRINSTPREIKLTLNISVVS